MAPLDPGRIPCNIGDGRDTPGGEAVCENRAPDAIPAPFLETRPGFQGMSGGSAFSGSGSDSSGKSCANAAKILGICLPSAALLGKVFPGHTSALARRPDEGERLPTWSHG